MSDWRELLAGHLLTCVESQARLADTIGEKRWSVDVPGGVISFSGGPSYRADLIGSASAEQGTWLWAWANQHLPESAAAASGRLRRALRLGPLTGPDLRSTLLSGIGLYGTDHRAAVRSYLTGRGAELAGNGPEWVARTADGQQTQLTFDEQGRLAAVNATLKADRPRAGPAVSGAANGRSGKNGRARKAVVGGPARRRPFPW